MNVIKNILFYSNYRGVFFVIALIVLNSCQEVKMPERPENLISEDKIVKIYTDAYINNAAKNVNNKLLIESGVKLDSILYKKHKIDSLQFAMSNAYYSSDLSKYAKLFERVELRLKVFQTRADSLTLVFEIEAEEALCDSLYPKDSLQVKSIEVDSIKVDSTLIEPAVSD